MRDMCAGRTARTARTAGTERTVRTGATVGTAWTARTGATGIDGKDGADGRDGTDGRDGANGKDGADGEDGTRPYVGANGNWWIDGVDLGVAGERESVTPENYSIRAVAVQPDGSTTALETSIAEETVGDYFTITYDYDELTPVQYGGGTWRMALVTISGFKAEEFATVTRIEADGVDVTAMAGADSPVASGLAGRGGALPEAGRVVPANAAAGQNEFDELLGSRSGNGEGWRRRAAEILLRLCASRSL